jgi:general secretion pathway protein D
MGMGTPGQQAQVEEPKPMPSLDLTAEQIQELERARADATSDEGRDAVDELLRRHRARIYVTAVRRNNQLVVRTSDRLTMKRIRELITQLDVPTPLVLLEVKVLQLDLGDNFTSAFDYQFNSNSGEIAGQFTSGDLLAPPASPIGTHVPLGLGAAAGVIAPVVAGASVGNGQSQPGPSNGPLIFQYVSNNFRMRIQMLENDNRVTELATPLLLTANNEVSHIFIGQYIPIVIGFTQSGAVTGGNTTTAVQPTPQTSYTSVGQGLLITPNINADRSVMLRVSQQNSSVNKGGASIPIATTGTTGTTGTSTTTTTLTNVAVDTVQTQVVTGTVVAKDGLTVALGGLITEGVADSRAEVPVLGKLPVIGFFFRRQVTIRSRTELVVLIRPFVFNTPSESAALSADLIPDNSLHPKAVNPVGSLNSFNSQEVLRPDPPQNPLQTIFRFHSVDPLVY